MWAWLVRVLVGRLVLAGVLVDSSRVVECSGVWLGLVELKVA